MSDFPKHIDNSIIKSFKGCGQRTNYAHLQHLMPVGPRSVDLHFGASFAKGAEVARLKFYEGGLLAAEAVEAGIEAAVVEWRSVADIQEKKYSNKTLDRLPHALRYLFEQWPLGDAEYLPVSDGIEKRFSFELPVNHPDTGAPLLYCGRFDMLATNSNNRLYIVDEKTTGKLGDSWVSQWEMDSQMSGYSYAVKQQNPTAEVIAQIRGVSILKADFGHIEANIVRKDWELERWHRQLVKDVQRMVLSYIKEEWDYALGNACNDYGRPCDYMMLCKSPNPKQRLDGNFVLNDWRPHK